jgi:prepilin-type N-terminal cleavage/methylation domain-containing protein
MARKAGHSGFTLLELLLVLLVVAIALAVASPLLQGWARGAQLRNLTEKMLAMTRYAHSKAVSEGKILNLYFSPDRDWYQLGVFDGLAFRVNPDANLSAPFGNQIVMPEGFAVEFARVGSENSQGICFYPSGRSDAGLIRITYNNRASNQEEQVNLESVTGADPFHVARELEGSY